MNFHFQSIPPTGGIAASSFPHLLVTVTISKMKEFRGVGAELDGDRSDGYTMPKAKLVKLLGDCDSESDCECGRG